MSTLAKEDRPVKVERRFFFRADGNAGIGTGHIRRCITIAHAAVAGGAKCTFLTADEQMKPLLEKQGFQLICLGSSWNEMEEELPKLLPLFSNDRSDMLVVDSYQVTPRYLAELNKHVRLVYLDDINRFKYPCDTLVNYNCYAQDMGYADRYACGGTRLVLGTNYVPLRGEFRDIPEPNYSSPVQHVLITTGGGDPYNVAEAIARKLMEIPTLHVHVVMGPFSTNKQEMDSLAHGHGGRIKLYTDVEKMSHLMRSCNMAVSAGGFTLYELCACGTPAIAFSFADNQLPACHKFGEQEMIYDGDARDGVEVLAIRIARSVGCLMENQEERRRRGRQMRALVDGRGADRLAEALFKG